jgi:cytochrome c553
MKTNLGIVGSGIALATAAIVAACSPSKTASLVAPAQTVQQQVEGLEHVCASCHGVDGNSASPTFPKLAGQQKEYLTNQLKAFRDKTRADPHAHTYMWGMAAHLTDEQIDGLATYFSSKRTSPGVEGDPTDMAAGKKLFMEGDPDHDVPACQACHGQNAEGNGQFPRLASQHREYLVEQLGNFASNARANEIMHQNAKPLTAVQVRELAAYLAAQ